MRNLLISLAFLSLNGAAFAHHLGTVCSVEFPSIAACETEGEAKCKQEFINIALEDGLMKSESQVIGFEVLSCKEIKPGVAMGYMALEFK